MNAPPEVTKLYKKLNRQAAQEANKRIRQFNLDEEFGAEDSIGKLFANTTREMLAMVKLGWNPYRPSTTGLGFTINQIDNYRLRNHRTTVQKIALDAIYATLVKNKVDFFQIFLQDVLIKPEEDSYFKPSKWDPYVGRYRNLFGRFSKPKYP